MHKGEALKVREALDLFFRSREGRKYLKFKCDNVVVKGILHDNIWFRRQNLYKIHLGQIFIIIPRP